MRCPHIGRRGLFWAPARCSPVRVAIPMATNAVTRTQPGDAGSPYRPRDGIGAPEPAFFDSVIAFGDGNRTPGFLWRPALLRPHMHRGAEGVTSTTATGISSQSDPFASALD